MIEIFVPDQKPLNSTSYDDKKYDAVTEYSNVQGFNLTQKEALELIKEVGFKHIAEIPYVTQTNRKRHIFICQK